MRVRGASIGRFEILLTTPFQQFAEPSLEVKQWMNQQGQSHKLKADYGIDVWVQHKKVLNIHWQEGEPVEIVSFRRGNWESELLSLGGREAG